MTDHQPTLGTAGDVILADLRHYLIADRQALTVERSRLGSGFPEDTSSFRLRARIDGRYWIWASTTTQTGQVVRPVVVLN